MVTKVNLGGGIDPAMEEELQLLRRSLMESRMSPTAKPAAAGRRLTVNLDPLVQGLRNRKTEGKISDLERKQADLTGAYRERVATRLREMAKAEEGQTQVTPLLDDQGEAVTNRLRNPLAYRDFLGDEMPEVRAAAEGKGKSIEPVLKAALEKASVGSKTRFLDSGNFRDLQAPEKYSVTDGALLRQPEEGPPEVMQPVRQVPLPGGKEGQMANQSYGGRLQGIGSPGTTNETRIENNLNPKAEDKFLMGEAEKLSASAQLLRKRVPETLRALSSAEQAAASGAFQGPMAQWLETAVGVAAQMGLTGPELNKVLANTERLGSDMGRFVLSALESTGTNPSNADREYAERTAGGKKLSPEGLKEVIKAARVDLANSIQSHNSSISGLADKIPSAVTAKIEPFAVRIMSGAGMKKLEGMPQSADVRQAIGAEDFSGYIQDPQSGFWTRDRRAPAAGTQPGAPKKDWRTDPAERQRRLRELTGG